MARRSSYGRSAGGAPEPLFLGAMRKRFAGGGAPASACADSARASIRPRSDMGVVTGRRASQLSARRAAPELYCAGLAENAAALRPDPGHRVRRRIRLRRLRGLRPDQPRRNPRGRRGRRPRDRCRGPGRRRSWRQRRLRDRRLRGRRLRDRRLRDGRLGRVRDRRLRRLLGFAGAGGFRARRRGWFWARRRGWRLESVAQAASTAASTGSTIAPIRPPCASASKASP